MSAAQPLKIAIMAMGGEGGGVLADWIVDLGEGRVDSAALIAHAVAAAKRFVRFDMAEAAEQNGSVISAVLFGALAGTGVLPFSRARFEATIGRGGVGVAPSLKAFATAYAHAAGVDPGPAVRAIPAHGDTVAAPEAAALDGTADAPPASRGPVPAPAAAVGVEATDARVRALLNRIERDFPASARTTLREGIRRLIDYQDPAYAGLYLDRLAPIAALPANDDGRLLDETARHLALWMSYEDTIRVAALKTRGSRFDRVRGEVRAGDDQVLAIDEYLHPRVQEIAETLPAVLGRWIERPGWPRRLVERLTRRGRIVTTSSLSGFLMLYAVAGMKRWRRSTTRFAAEDAAIVAWLACVADTAARNPELAVEVAQCQRLVKGYSDTHERGVRHFDLLMAAVRRAGSTLAPATLRELREAALADEQGDKLKTTLARHALA